jgi:transcriptional regulator with XRE-family HTH domain
MRLKQRQVELGLTDHDLAKAAKVARSTVYRAKTGKVSRYSVMEEISGALGFEVWDIDEFRDVLREKVYRDAEKVGAPPQVIDEADQMAEMFTITVPDEGTVQQAAFRLLRDVIAYLDRSGRTDLIDRAIREWQS